MRGKRLFNTPKRPKAVYTYSRHSSEIRRLDWLKGRHTRGNLNIENYELAMFAFAMDRLFTDERATLRDALIVDIIRFLEPDRHLRGEQPELLLAGQRPRGRHPVPELWLPGLLRPRYVLR